MKSIHNFIVALIVITLIIIPWYLVYGSSRVYSLSPDKLQFFPTNDRVQNGASTSYLDFDGNDVILNCELKKNEAYQWPYCGISVHVNDDPTVGIDFNKYHTIRMNVDFIRMDDQDATEAKLRFYLRNYNPEYSNPDDEYTHKYNGLEFTPGFEAGAIEIPLRNLQVMTWWLVDNDIPIKHAGPEYTNINKIEFATGSGAPVGHYKMVIHDVSFIGTYINGEDLFLGLLIVWVIMGVVISVSEIRRGRQVLNQAQVRQDHLKQINRSLRSQNYQFAELAHRDPLTGAMNRYSIRDWLKAQRKTSNGESLRLCILYLDIDYFKSVNDTYGHAVGDDILKEFAMVVLSSIRTTDRLVRWGGEEFVVYCPTTEIAEAEEIAERIRKTVENHIWVHGDRLTCCIGVTNVGKSKPAEALVRADEALYRAKNKGRNRIEVSRYSS